MKATKAQSFTYPLARGGLRYRRSMFFSSCSSFSRAISIGSLSSSMESSSSVSSLAFFSSFSSSSDTFDFNVHPWLSSETTEIHYYNRTLVRTFCPVGGSIWRSLLNATSGVRDLICVLFGFWQECKTISSQCYGNEVDAISCDARNLLIFDWNLSVFFATWFS